MCCRHQPANHALRDTGCDNDLRLQGLMKQMEKEERTHLNCMFVEEVNNMCEIPHIPGHMPQ